jgi:beta-galactosidase
MVEQIPQPDLSHLDIHWELLQDGQVVQTGSLPPLMLGPDEKGELVLPFSQPNPLTPGSEYHLNIRFVLNRDFPWAAKGHEVSWEQFNIPFPSPAKPGIGIASMPDLSVKDSRAADHSR